jgi:hypothetical protein
MTATKTIATLKQTPDLTVPVTYFDPYPNEWQATVTPGSNPHQAKITLPTDPPRTLATTWTTIALAINSEISIQVLRSGELYWDPECLNDNEVQSLINAIGKN